VSTEPRIALDELDVESAAAAAGMTATDVERTLQSWPAVYRDPSLCAGSRALDARGGMASGDIGGT
jgi:hypothetical protein